MGQDEAGYEGDKDDTGDTGDGKGEGKERRVLSESGNIDRVVGVGIREWSPGGSYRRVRIVIVRFGGVSSGYVRTWVGIMLGVAK